MSKVIIKLPMPTDADGRELTVEECEELAQEPEYVRVPLEINGKTFEFVVAADFDQVSREADQSYQLLKSKEYKIRVDERRKRNSKLTNLVEENDDNDNVLSGDQYRKLLELRPEQRSVFTELVLPCICGHNVPKMPEINPQNVDKGILRAWFESGGKTQTAVLEALVMSYDPTAFLAEEKRAARRQQEMMAQLQKQLEQQIADLKLTDESTADETEIETTLETPTLETTTETEQTPKPDSLLPSPAAGDSEPAAVSGASPTSEL